MKFNEVICGAMEENITLQFTYYQKGEIKKLVGKIHYIDGLKKEVRIINLTSEKRILELGDIIEIEYY